MDHLYLERREQEGAFHSAYPLVSRDAEHSLEVKKGIIRLYTSLRHREPGDVGSKLEDIANTLYDKILRKRWEKNVTVHNDNVQRKVCPMVTDNGQE